jgi:hypothetical protein
MAASSGECEKRNNAESEKASWRKAHQRIGRKARVRAARITNAPSRAALAANAENQRNAVSLAKNNGVKWQKKKKNDGNVAAA